MKLNIHIKKIGCGYRKAIFGQTWNEVRECWDVDSVFGADEEELLARLKTRLPGFKNQLRSIANRSNESTKYCK